MARSTNEPQRRGLLALCCIAGGSCGGLSPAEGRTRDPLDTTDDKDRGNERAEGRREVVGEEGRRKGEEGRGKKEGKKKR